MNGLRLNSIVERVRPAALVLGVVGLAGAGFGMMSSKDAALQSYVFAFLFFMYLTLGCFGLTLLHHTVVGRWGLTMLRMFEAGGGAASLAVMAVLFVPIAANLPAIYAWADPSAAADHVIHSKALYLTTPFFLARAVGFFALWILIAWRLRQWSLKQDETHDRQFQAKRTNLSAISLVLFFVTVNFAATDWGMSLEPKYYSTIYGLLTVVGSALAAFSLVTMLVLKSSKDEPYQPLVDHQQTKDMGNLLFTMTMLWAYMTLSQFLITWSANLPEEIPYYLARNQKGWNYLGMIVLGCQFFIPFFALLAPRVKRYKNTLFWAAALIFATRILDVFWLVMPALRTNGLQVSLLDLAAWVGVGGIWFFVFGSELKKAVLLPTYDPRISVQKESMEHA